MVMFAFNICKKLCITMHLHDFDNRKLELENEAAHNALACIAATVKYVIGIIGRASAGV